MAKRGALRRPPGEEPDFPALMRRPYRSQPVRRLLPDVDVAAIRARLGLSQPGFAHRFGFPLATLRLLHVIAYHPAVATRAILRAKRLATRPPA